MLIQVDKWDYFHFRSHDTCDIDFYHRTELITKLLTKCSQLTDLNINSLKDNKIESNGTSLSLKFNFNHKDWSFDISRSLFETWPHWRTPLISNKENIFNIISSGRPSIWKNDNFWHFDIISVSWKYTKNIQLISYSWTP